MQREVVIQTIIWAHTSPTTARTPICLNSTAVRSVISKRIMIMSREYARHGAIDVLIITRRKATRSGRLAARFGSYKASTTMMDEADVVVPRNRLTRCSNLHNLQKAAGVR